MSNLNKNWSNESKWRMKAKMYEIYEIWAINRRNLGQNSHWNINLPLKINFGHWIKNWEQSGRLIAITIGITSRPSDHVAWRRGNITKKSAIYLRYITDILSLEAIFSKKSPIYLPEPIYHRYIPTFSSLHTPDLH